MPGFSLKLHGLRGRTAPRNHATLRATAGLVLVCLGLIPALTRADAAAALPAPAPAVHITDAQDLLATRHLSAEAEARSRANALYAAAMLEGPDSQSQATLNELLQVASLDPHFADAQVKIAGILMQGGQIHEALKQLQTAAIANPQSVAIKTTLGYVQRANGNTSEALRLSREALTKDPTQVTAMRVLLDIAGSQHDLAGGVLHIEDILKSAGVTAPASSWLTLARYYVEAARANANPPTNETVLKTLLPIYQQAAAKPPPEVETLTLLSDTCRDLGRKHEALKVLQEAGALDPTNIDIILRCADLQTGLELKAEALKSYERAYALSPGLTGLREMLGRLYLVDGRFEDSVRLLEKPFADAPQDAGLGIDLGIAYEGSHQNAKAQNSFQQVLAADSCPPEAYLKLAVFQLGNKQVSEAAATLAAAEKRFPKSLKVRFYEAIQHRYEKNYAAALASLDQMRQLAPGGNADALDLDFYLENALNLNLIGHKDRIQDLLQEGLSKYPDSPDLMNELAYFWADGNNHLGEALSLSKRASELAPDNGAIQDTRGWVYFQMGKPKDALPYLQRAAILTNNDPVVLQHIGDTCLKLGLRSQAIAAWRRALEKDPRNGDLANRIDAALAQAKNAHSRSAPNP